MKILIVTAEFAPYAKTGGLADATAGLSHALSEAGHDVRVLIPRYPGIRVKGARAFLYRDGESVVRLFRLTRKRDGVRVYLCYVPSLSRVKDIYAGDDRDALRFLALSEAATAFSSTINWRPDVIHCHDWHAALVPTAIKAHNICLPDKAINTPTVLTLHNMGYQGVFPMTVFAKYGYERILSVLPRSESAQEHCNFLRVGILTADALTTVSPTYAREIQTVQFGMGLEDYIVKRRQSLTGILNGVDYSSWDPRNDPYLEQHYDRPEAGEKFAIKSELCERVGLRCARDIPVIGIVSRLAEQKGIDLIVDALPDLLKETNAVFAMLGSGDPKIGKTLHALASKNPQRVAFTEGYDEELAHLIIAGSDMFVVPSRYEPCGLTQLYSLRYGTIPIVRATGGLADTVHQFDPDSGTGNGCIFRDADADGLKWAVRTAMRWYAQPDAWLKLMGNAMSADFSWHARIPEYAALYGRLIGT